jgi:hypothetical protein
MSQRGKKVIVVGTLHEQQMIEGVGTIFEERLRSYIRRSNVSIVIEEWKFDDDQTLGKRLADDLAIAWRNAGTPKQEEFETYGPCPLWLDSSCVTERPYGPIEAQVRRESYMIDRICAEMTDHTAGLFICGIAHLHSISEKLHQVGYKVEGVSCLGD